MANREDETKDRLNRLEKVFGSFDYDPKNNESFDSRKKGNRKFKTTEVAIILVIGVVVSLIMGSFITLKLYTPSGEKVDSELQEFISNYEYITDNYNGKINKEELLDAALEAMLSKLDKNSTYLESDDSKNFNILLEGSYSGLGIQVYNDDDKNLVIYSVFKNSPADKAGLKPDDIITAINGKNVKGMTSADLAKMITKLNGKKVKLAFIRDKKEQTVYVELGKINIESVASNIYKKEGNKIGYIGVSIFASNTYNQFKKELDRLEGDNIDALVIDLRSNSGGYLSTAENMISLFLDSNHIIYQIQKDSQITKHHSKGVIDKKYKIVVLVNEQSASASEIMASALHEQYGATLVGKKTYGKGTVQELQDLKSGDKFKLTTKNWLTSKGNWVNEKGINPDIEIDLSDRYKNNPSEENDGQLQAALDAALDNTK